MIGIIFAATVTVFASSAVVIGGMVVLTKIRGF